VASVLPYADPVHKISIIARGRALGYVFKLPLEDNKLQSKKEFLDDIAVSLGGYVTEKILFNDSTLYRKLAENGRKLAREKYDWKNIALLMRKVYRKYE